MPVQSTKRETLSVPGKKPGRAPGRPKKVTRVPIGSYRDILKVEGLEQAYKDYKFRWIADGDDTGQRVIRFKMAGYEMVSAEELREKGLQVGDDQVFQSSNVGSVIRIPNGRTGGYLYLMKILREWYEEDQKVKQDALIDVERTSMEPGEGEYGKFSTNWGTREDR